MRNHPAFDKASNGIGRVLGKPRLLQIQPTRRDISHAFGSPQCLTRNRQPNCRFIKRHNTVSVLHILPALYISCTYAILVRPKKEPQTRHRDDTQHPPRTSTRSRTWFQDSLQKKSRKRVLPISRPPQVGGQEVNGLSNLKYSNLRPARAVCSNQSMSSLKKTLTADP